MPAIRLRAFLSLLVIIAVGLALKFAPGPTWVRNATVGAPYVIAWCLLFYTFVAHPRAIVPITIAVLAVTCALEALQAWNPPFLEPIREHRVARALIGHVFSWTDFPAYFVGAAIAWLWMRTISRPPEAANE